MFAVCNAFGIGDHTSIAGSQVDCVVCHSVNGIGAQIAPPLDTATMPRPMDPFSFIARMWRGSAAMALMQEEIFGDVIDLSGQDLVDLVAFAYDEEEQKKLSKDQIPENLRNLLK